MAGKLTDAAVSRARVPAGKRQAFLWDTTVTGFGVRILPSGSKTFWFQYRPPGGRSVSARMISIGKFPAIKVDKARKRAGEFYGEVAGGGDPAAKRKAERTRDKAT